MKPFDTETDDHIEIEYRGLTKKCEREFIDMMMIFASSWEINVHIKPTDNKRKDADEGGQ